MTSQSQTIRVARPIEREQLLAVAVATERFTADEAEGLLGGVLDAFAAGTLDDRHEVLVAEDASREPSGWSYFAPDPYADGVWNLWWIGVHPSQQGSGAGRALLHAIETHVERAGARVLVIETSDQDGLARARRFYEREGYTARGIVPDFYGAGDGKVIFSKSFAR